MHRIQPVARTTKFSNVGAVITEENLMRSSEKVDTIGIGNLRSL